MKHRIHDLLPAAILTGLALVIPTRSISQTPSDVIPISDGVAPGTPPAGAPAGTPGPLMQFGPVELDAIADGQQAVKLVRTRAKAFGIDPQRIGIIGFSAGGAVSGGAAVRGQPAEIHIYAKGRHGFGTAHQGLPVDHWLDAFHAWLAQQGFVPQ